MDKINKKKKDEAYQKDLESHFLYLKHHMKYMNDNQKKNVTKGMSHRLKKEIGFYDEEDQIRK